MPSNSPYLRTSLLRHELPDGSSHFDWLIERAPGEPRLLTIRLDTNPLTVTDWPISGEQLPDHRRLYLDYEGPVSNARGSVSRLARGTLRQCSDPPIRRPQPPLGAWQIEIATLRGILLIEPDPAIPCVRLSYRPDLCPPER